MFAIKSSPKVILAILIAHCFLTGCTPSPGASSKEPLPFGQSNLPSATPAERPAGSPEILNFDGIQAPIIPIKTTQVGELIPPTNVSHLGWWVDSSIPGSGSGTIVITGHVDDIAQGRGVAARFAHLKPGSEIVINDGTKRQWTYRVTSVHSYDKRHQLPIDELNRIEGPESLALVTCGGAFLGGALGYQNNDIVWAQPIIS
ncbi:MAG: class F sortase [Mycobacteriaceae bacterium]